MNPSTSRVVVKSLFHVVPSPLYCFHRSHAGGRGPRAAGRKTKTPCRSVSHTAQETNVLMQHKHKICMHTKPPFTRKAGMAYNIPCGAAGWPLCRCLVHLRRFAGVGAPASCRIFVFQAKYSTAHTPLQAFFGKNRRDTAIGMQYGKKNGLPRARSALAMTGL